MRNIVVQRNPSLVPLMDVILFLDKLDLLDQVVFCGSISLYLNGWLKRLPNDIDMLTLESWYKVPHPLYMYQELGSKGEERSHKFNVGNQQITCTKTNLFGKKIDILHNPELSINDYETVSLELYRNEDNKCFPVKILLEDPGHAVRFKIQYIKHDKSSDSKEKHIKDILDMVENGIVMFPKIVSHSDDIVDEIRSFGKNEENDLPF